MKPLTICSHCGQTSHYGKGCPKRKKVSGKHKPREIVALDCETNSAGIVLFLASTEDRKTTYLYEGGGLGVKAILTWIVESCAGRLCFGFYFDYDVNQIIGLLPELHQSQLAATGKVTFKGFKIRHVPGKRFMVGDSERMVTVWDCASWAQCSFIRVCDEWRLGTPEEREIVRRMKAKRGDFDDATEAELVEYTTLECSLLCEWVRRLLELHDEAGIVLRAYSGPGSTASAMVRAVGWKPPEVEAKIQEIAESAFFGGRTEISCIGPVNGPVYGYDINSAYPAAIAGLPEIEGKKWAKVKTWAAGCWGFYRVRWKQAKTQCWGLFPMRGAVLPSGRRSISLLYPTEGEGWFHSHEVRAALDVAPDCVEILEGYVIGDSGRPFAWVAESVKLRMHYKAIKDERAFPLKVGLNSIYGKLAQHSGTHPLQCMAYAASVTAQTRAALLRAAYPRKHGVILLATDGILATTPLDELPIGKGMGQWETETYDSAWMLQAGVYWAGQKKRTRGIDARSLTLEDVQSTWARRGTAGRLTLPSRRVMGYRLCASQNKLHMTGKWCDSERTVKFSAQPRRRSWRWDGDRMLTVPAAVASYREQMRLDSFMVAMEGPDDDPQPDWALD